MKRYFSDEKFERLCKDFAFLVSKAKDYKGELDIRLRDNYFNLYYKGNSLAKIIIEYNPGDEVSLKVLRGEEEKIIDVTLGER